MDIVIENFDSSNIATFSYDIDEEVSTLSITFKSGSTYDYLHVPKHIFVDMSVAPSKGKFFNTNIKSFFDWVKK